MAAQFTTYGADTGSSGGTTVTASENAKGSWVEVTSSTGHAAKWLTLIVRTAGSNSSASYLVDIGTGAASSEVVLIPDILVDLTVTPHALIQSCIPVDIPSGTRLAIRAEGSSGGGTEDIRYTIIISDERPPALSTIADFTSYGTTAGADDKGLTVDPGGTANTKGSYVELTSSFDADGEWVYFIFGSDTNAAMTDADFLVDIATGAAASETVQIDNIFLEVDGTTDIILPAILGPFPGNTFQGARVAVRAQSDIIDVTDRLFSVAAISVNGAPEVGGGGGGVRNPLVGPVGP